MFSRLLFLLLNFSKLLLINPSCFLDKPELFSSKPELFSCGYLEGIFFWPRFKLLRLVWVCNTFNNALANFFAGGLKLKLKLLIKLTKLKLVFDSEIKIKLTMLRK